MVMGWQHVSGFNVYNEVLIKPKNEKGLEEISQCIIRNVCSLEKFKHCEKANREIDPIF